MSITFFICVEVNIGLVTGRDKAAHGYDAQLTELGGRNVCGNVRILVRIAAVVYVSLVNTQTAFNHTIRY